MMVTGCTPVTLLDAATYRNFVRDLVPSELSSNYLYHCIIIVRAGNTYIITVIPVTLSPFLYMNISYK